MLKGEGIKILKNEFIFWSRLGFGVDPSVCDEDGIVLYDDIEINIKRHKDMFKSGVKVHTFILPSGWIGDGKYDFRTTDKVLDTFFEELPDAYCMPRIKFNPPVEWLLNNPDEIYRFEDGQIRLENKTNDNDTGEVAYQSFSSKKWLKAAEAALEKIVKHIENKDYADKIIGYHVAYGKCGETHFWGNCADFGVTNRKEFLQWGIRKYGSLEKTAKEWGVENLSYENVPIQKNEVRYAARKNLKEFFNADDNKKAYVDYNIFRSDITFNAASTLCKKVKDLTGKVTGLFHGYLLHGGVDIVGHTDIERILNSPYIDFICAPKVYNRNGYGEPCGSYCVPQSVNRKKLWIDELDNRTHLSKQRILSPTNDFHETRWVLWRDFARNEMAGASYWWMDLMGGWYESDEMYEEISRIYEAKKQLNAMNKESIAEILLVVEDENMNDTTSDDCFFKRCLRDAICETASVGAPFDMYLQRDLDNIDLKKYKLIYFLNSFAMSDEYFENIKEKLNKNTVLIWNYAPGVISNGFSYEDIYKRTGMKIIKTGKFDKFPYIEISNDEDVEIIEEYDGTDGFGDGLENIPNSGIKTAKRGNNVLCALPSLKAQVIRKFAELSGCRMYAPVGSIVYGDSRFLSIFNKEKIKGQCELFNGTTFEYDLSTKNFDIIIL